MRPPEDWGVSLVTRREAEEISHERIGQTWLIAWIVLILEIVHFFVD